MINILKLDHRPFRDKRITTHCALVSRAFGADKFYYSGIEDNVFEKSVSEVNKQWGGDFKTEYIKNPKKLITDFKGIKIHLTMYGQKIVDAIEDIKQKIDENLIIVVGGPKVDRFYYESSDYNISITNQPHSEVAALAIILNYINPTAIDGKIYENKKINIEPNKKGKKVISLK